MWGKDMLSHNESLKKGFEKGLGDFVNGEERVVE